jgi:hypothetical protein
MYALSGMDSNAPKTSPKVIDLIASPHISLARRMCTLVINQTRLVAQGAEISSKTKKGTKHCCSVGTSL